MLMRRLYLQIYLTIIASLVLVVVVGGLLWTLFGRDHFNREAFDVASRLAQVAIPDAGDGEDLQRKAIERLSRELSVEISLYDRQNQLVGAFGKIRPLPRWKSSKPGWHRIHRGRVWLLTLEDGRAMVVDLGRRRARRPLLNLVLFLGSVALGVGLGAYPLVRRLTRRLERLQQGVERIGAGDFSTRVEVSGRDEVARLAASFNDAAEKIDDLIGAHRLLLANASHELRTPLSRIRLGLEMMDAGDDNGRRAALQQDIAELDCLIDEILLMSRLDAGSYADTSQKIDLVALAAEECARFADCSVSGSAPEISGDPRLLRRLVTNLLDNAHHHGVPPVTVMISTEGDKVTMIVRDSGDGIAEADREKVFQPFYRASDRQNVSGYGLGLPLVRQIAETHGGTVGIMPSSEMRSAIRVELPI